MIKIKHLAKKSGLSKKKLKALFLENGVIEKIKQKFVDKDVAKTFLRDIQGINKYGYSKMGYFEDFGSYFSFNSLFGLLGVLGLFGLLFSLMGSGSMVTPGTLLDHEVASLSAPILQGGDVFVQEERVVLNEKFVEREINLADGDAPEEGRLKELINDIEGETVFTHDVVDEDTQIHFVPPVSLPATGV